MMRAQLRSKALMSAAVVMGWTWLTAATCIEIGGVPETYFCSWTHDDDFPTGGQAFRNKPQTCPIAILGATNVPYSATIILPAGSVTWDRFRAQQIDLNGIIRSMSAYPVWSTGNDGSYFVNVTATYTAGIGGFDAGDEGYDDIQNSFVRAGVWTSATARIPYNYGVPSTRFEAPSTVDASAYYNVTASTNDPLMVSPLSWSWYVNGSYIGSTGESPELSVQAGGPNSSQNIQATATDPNGRTISGTATVWTYSGCVDEHGEPVDQC
jgi:hypothetical protein